MKKLGKSIILLGITTTAIAVSSMLQAVETIKPEILKQETQRYNHKSANMLDNVFVEGNTKYLPFIFENSTDKITEDDIKADFSAAGLTVNEIKRTDELIGTGTTITVKENSDEYNVIVYGDVDGDGYVDTMDSYQIILHVKRPSTNALKGIYLKAGNILNDEDTMADTLDAYQIILFQKGRAPQLVEVEPTSTIPSNQPPVITLKDSSSIEIKVGESYSQYLDKSNAKATNKYGGDISDKVEVTHNINNAVTGTYYITYSVKDNNGVSANVVTRTVTVKSNSVTPPTPTKRVTSIEVGKMPTNKSYNYGATKADVDMAGATITVNYNIGSPDTVNVTNSMVESVDFSQVGEGTITVKYEGKTAEFKITVLSKITDLTLNKDGQQNIILSENGNYNTTAKQFTLGTIVEVTPDGGSSLTKDDLAITVKENNVNTESLKLQPELKDGKILLNGTVSKAGEYDVTISIYDEEIKLERTIIVESVLTSVKLADETQDVTNLVLLTTQEKKVNVQIVDQYGNKMNDRLGAKDIVSDTDAILKSTLLDGQIGIVVPEAYSTLLKKDTAAVTIKLYEEDNQTIASGDVPAYSIGITIKTSLKIDTTSLSTKTLRIVQKASDGTLKDLCTPITISVE